MARRVADRTTFSRALRAGMPRVALAALALGLGYVSVVQSLAYVIGKTRPDQGYKLAPSDGRIAALFAERLSGADASAVQRQRAGRIARAALYHEPLAVPAIAVLGLNAVLTGDDATARRLFTHSSALSRRHLPTRLWLIEDAVQHDNIPAAIHHYDIALRTSRSASEHLFPILSAAVGDPAIAAVLAPTLASRPPWGDTFVHYLSTSGSDPKTTANFFRLLVTHRVAIPEDAESAVVNALVAAHSLEDAWAYYRTLRPGVDRRRSRDTDFAAELAAPTAFDWTPVMNGAGITASIQRTAANGQFDFAAPSTVGGTVLEQLQLLPPGRYRIVGRSIGIDQPERSRPYWALICTDGRELGRVDLPNSSTNGGRFEGIFNVERSCPSQLLRLIVRPSSLITGASGQIDRVALLPL